MAKRKSEREAVKDEILSRLKDRPKARSAFERIYADQEVTSYLNMANVMAVKRLGYNDHGPVHAAIAANNSLKILDLIAARSPPTIVNEAEGDMDDSTLVTVIGAYLHDIGNAVHRRDHQIHAIPLAQPLVKRLTEEIYGQTPKAIQIECEILNTVYSHEEDIRCVTVESGCARVGDGTDMEKGRARYPYRRRSIDIHSLSAMSIEKVEILRGRRTPVLIRIHSTGTAGIFQVEKVLGEKIRTSGIARHITVQALVDGKDVGFRLRLQ
jgi:metal-dependent HD superfamily phosphatase/phosphodiesterase